MAYMGDYVDLDRVAFISGPSFAKEVMASLPTALKVSSSNMELAKRYTMPFQTT